LCAAFLATPIIIPNPVQKIKFFFQKNKIFFENCGSVWFSRGEKAVVYGGRLPKIVVYYIG